MLGSHNPLPVEVVPFACAFAQKRLLDIATKAEMRRTVAGDDYVTDNGNLILDCHFKGGIGDPASAESEINKIPGIVENGLFIQLTHLVIVGCTDGTCRTIVPPN